MRAPPRLNRLPQRLDYTLIPAPLDLSLPLADEKSLLPAIIVTPSSPSCPTDFSIAFIAPPPKTGFFTRLSSRCTFQLKARTTLLILLPLFILLCHMLTHRIATLQPHLNFDTHSQQAFDHLPSSADSASSGSIGGWLDLESIWGLGRDGKIGRAFVIDENAK